MSFIYTRVSYINMTTRASISSIPLIINASYKFFIHFFCRAFFRSRFAFANSLCFINVTSSFITYLSPDFSNSINFERPSNTCSLKMR